MACGFASPARCCSYSAHGRGPPVRAVGGSTPARSAPGSVGEESAGVILVCNSIPLPSCTDRIQCLGHVTVRRATLSPQSRYVGAPGTPNHIRS